MRTAHNFKDRTGQRFGRLVVIHRVENSGKEVRWLCLCDCGKRIATQANNLRSGASTSCGCYREEFRATHRMSGTPTYNSWLSMMHRCYHQSTNGYESYGGRGIIVADQWHEFDAFLTDMGERPKGMTLERVDVNGNYTPENCKWATSEEQYSNKRNSVLLTYGGRTMTTAEWARELGGTQAGLNVRLQRLHWPLERALSEPFQKRCHKGKRRTA